MARKQRRIPKYQQEAEQPNRVPTDPSQYAPHNSWSTLPAFYEDIVFRCRDCGADEIWTAEQQKWWYEVAKGPFTRGRCAVANAGENVTTKSTEHRARRRRNAVPLN